MAIGDVHDRRMFTTDEIIFREGEVGRRCAYLIESGKVEISKKTEKGEQIVLGVIPAGGIFGEMGIVDPRPHSATIFAVTNVDLYVINEQQFLMLVSKTPLFALRVMRILARRIRAMNLRLTEADRVMA